MPSTTPKQRRVMSAISHGWHPTHGSVAKIPVKVAKEFHAADKGHKYGKGMHHKKADGGKIKAAMHTVRKYAKKADGGDVDDDEPAAPKGDKQQVGPDWSKYNQPMGQLAPAQYSPTQNTGNMVQDAMVSAGMEPYVAGHLTSGVGSVIQHSPLALPGTAADFVYAHHQGDTAGQVQAALGMMPGAGDAAKAMIKGFTKKAVESDLIPQIHDAVLGAAAVPAEMHPAAGALSQQLKSYYGKDVAQSAYYLGVQPDEIGNLESYMSKGAQKNFHEHYDKLVAPKAKPAAAETVDAASPTAWNKQSPEEAQAIKNAWEPTSATEVPNAPDDWYDNQFKTSQEEAAEDEYEAAQAKQQANQQRINEGHSSYPTSKHLTQPENVLHPALSPADLAAKSAALGLNTTVFHGTRHNFSEFKLPEEMENYPELGVHFGTLRAAIDRAGKGYHPAVRQIIEDNLRKNAGIVQNPLSLTPTPPSGTTGKTFQVIPAKIGANNPLYIGQDLGTWGPSKIRDALMKHPDFDPDELNQAMQMKLTPTMMSNLSPHYEAAEQIQNLRKLVESKGYDSMTYRNNVEDPGSLSYIIWHPEKARSFYAKFDPAKAGSRNLGAAIGGLSLVPLGLYGADSRGQQAQGNGMAKGGKVKQIDEDPQDHEFIDFSKGGLIDSDIPGRTDKIPMKVPPGSFVLPADIPSALGQGNTKAGAEVLKKMFTSGPYGLPPPKGGGKEFHFPSHFSMRVPDEHHVSPHHKAAGGPVGGVKKDKTKVNYREADSSARRCGTCKFAYGPTGQRHCWLVEGMIKPDDVCNLWEGGIAKKAEGGSTDHVPIITAGGEWIVHPDMVKHMGNGDMKTGHKVLTSFVNHTRKEHIKTLKGLKPPK